MVGNLRAAGLTGAAHERSIVIASLDVRDLTPEFVADAIPAADHLTGGVFCFNPPYGVRLGGEAGDSNLLDLYADIGRALGAFTGWRAACFVANPRFVYAFGHSPSMTKPATNAELPGAFYVYQF
jgi:23S rRNA G2445 N2-methylase RlmL